VDTRSHSRNAWCRNNEVLILREKDCDVKSLNTRRYGIATFGLELATNRVDSRLRYVQPNTEDRNILGK